MGLPSADLGRAPIQTVAPGSKLLKKLKATGAFLLRREAQLRLSVFRKQPPVCARLAWLPYRACS